MTVSDSDVLEALRDATDPRDSPAVTAGDVADRLPIGAEAVRQRLVRLAADDEVGTRSFGRGRGFWPLPDRGDRLVDDVDQEASDDDVRDGPVPHRSPAVDDVGDERAPSGPATRAEAVADLDVPGYGSDVDDRREAVRYALDVLEADGPHRKADLAPLVFDEHTGGYADAESLWRNCLAGAFRDLEAAGVVVGPGSDRSEPTWRLVD